MNRDRDSVQLLSEAQHDSAEDSTDHRMEHLFLTWCSWIPLSCPGPGVVTVVPRSHKMSHIMFRAMSSGAHGPPRRLSMRQLSDTATAPRSSTRAQRREDPEALFWQHRCSADSAGPPPGVVIRLHRAVFIVGGSPGGEFSGCGHWHKDRTAWRTLTHRTMSGGGMIGGTKG